MSAKQDHWSAEAYQNAASFVPALTSVVLQYLNPQADDAILDIGCGDGALTAQLAGRCKTVTGCGPDTFLDSSASFLKTARDKVSSKHGNAHFFEYDCRRLDRQIGEAKGVIQANRYDRVFSNAAMHWILRDESSRTGFFTDVYKLTKPGGFFAFEQGGFQNVSEVHTALRTVLNLQHGIALSEIEKANPWFFPTDEWMRKTLEHAGFEVQKVELEHRPTKLTEQAADGSGGLEGWIRLMGANFLDLLNEPEERQRAVQSMCSVLEPIITKPEDSSQWLGYVRLRALARKPM